MPRKAKSQEEKWILFNFLMPPMMKYRIEHLAFRKRIKQSVMARFAMDEYLAKYADEEDDKGFVEMMTRQQQEKMNLARPKDTHTSRMIPIQAWKSIRLEQKEYDIAGVLRDEDFDAWIDCLEQNKASIEQTNPEYERIIGTFDLLIAKLRQEREEYKCGKISYKV